MRNKIVFHYIVWSLCCHGYALSFDPSPTPEQTTGCTLPHEFKGKWYLNECRNDVLVIDDTSISPLNNGSCDMFGICTEHKRNSDHHVFKFLYSSEDQLRNSTRNCTRCVQLHRRHANVIAFRESECAEDSGHLSKTLDDLCKRITSSEKFHYLIRDEAEFIPCPLSPEPMTFAYKASSDRICNSSESYTEVCHDNARIMFKYGECPDMGQSKVQEVKCLGNWTEDRLNYFIAKVDEGPKQESMIPSDSKYNCFVYEKVKDSNWNKKPSTSSRIRYRLSISPTASCHGLTATDSGEVSLDMTTASMPTTSCSFPHWFTSVNTWTSLDHHVVFRRSGRASELMFEEQVVKVGHIEEVKAKLLCRQAPNFNESESGTQSILAKEVVGCQHRDVCITFSRKSKSLSLVEVLYPNEKMTKDQFKTSCVHLNGHHHSSSEDGTFHSHSKESKSFVLIKENPEVSECPFVDQVFSLKDLTKNDSNSVARAVMRDCSDASPDPLFNRHPTWLRSGCDKPSTQEFKDDCGKDSSTVNMVGECMGHWNTDDELSYVVKFNPASRSKGNKMESPFYYCFVTNATHPIARQQGITIQVRGSLGHCDCHHMHSEEQTDHMRHQHENGFPSSYHMEAQGSCENANSFDALGSGQSGMACHLAPKTLIFVFTLSVIFAFFI